MEPEFAALNFPRFEPEEDDVAENEEVSSEPWYASPFCPWNWIYPFVTGESDPVPAPGAAPGSGPAGSPDPAPSLGGSNAPGVLPGVGSLIPGTTILTTIGGKKKAKVKPAATAPQEGGASAGSPPASKATAGAAK